MKNNISKELYLRAINKIPGGVNSPARACSAVKTDPIFFEKGRGVYLFDVDGNQYIDFVCSWGPLILGHCNKKIQNAITEAMNMGSSFGAPTRLEVEMAELVVDMVPSIEKIRMVNSGTEATMSAIRLARGYTKKDKVIKFTGCYHGHVDSLLVEAGSAIATLSIPGSPGIPNDFAKNTYSLPYNDIDTVELTLKNNDNIACIIVEPVVGNMGCVLPKPGFLKGLRELCDKYNALLIFDEVITGFRLSRGGAQERFGIMPDLTCLGKIIGGGLPVGAYGGKTGIMSMIAPDGPVYQAGTLSGNPLAMAAGLATLKELNKKGVYENLEINADYFFNGLKQLSEDKGIEHVVNHIGGMGTFFFTSNSVDNFDEAKKSNTEMFGAFFRELASNGIYFPPSQFETIMISMIHDRKIMDKALNIVDKIFHNLKQA